MKLGWNDHCMIPYKNYLKKSDPPKTLVVMATKRKILKNLLQNGKAKSFDIWFVALVSGRLPRCSNYTPGVKIGPPQGHLFYILI